MTKTGPARRRGHLGSGFIGKDWTTYEYLVERFDINNHEKEYALDLILWLENREITDSQRRLKAEYDRIKRNG